MAKPATTMAESAPMMAPRPTDSLDDILQNLDAGFSETLIALIDARGMTDVEVYKRANMTRQHFSKIRKNRHYRPTKQTVLALAVALRLTVIETTDLLARAGFALTHADKRDIIVEYHLVHGIYDINVINICLFDYDQPLLG
jgi:transcriptional regulator with XRE-family HTH domain